MTRQEVKWTIFVITVIGNFIAMIDSSSVNLALFEIAKDFNTAISSAQWVIISYMLTLTVLLPLFGKLGDILPKNKLYAGGFLIFALGAFLNTTASSLPLLIFYRCIEAVGASIMISNASAIIATIFKQEQRGKALGINGCVVALGGLSGPALGGVLLNFFGWNYIFIPSIVIALFGAYLSYQILPSYVASHKIFKFDYAGFFYFTTSLVALLLAISEGYNWGWGSLKIIVLSVVALLFGALFYIRDHKINYPFINFDVFKIKSFTLGNLAIVTSYMAMFTNNILIPIFLQDILKFNPLKTGLLMLPFSICLAIAAPFCGAYAGKHGSKNITRLGPLVMVLALLLFTTFNTDTQIWQIILASCIMGVANGLFQSPSNTAIIACVSREQLGVASGIIALSRNVGNIMGVSLTITFFSAFKDYFLSNKIAYELSFLKAYHYTMLIGIGFAFVCFLLAFFAYKDEVASR
ncbi:MAG: MFS transporter [Candidatus Gastranaerophilales bacterium]